MKRVLTYMVALGLLFFANDLQAQSKLTEEQKEQAIERFEEFKEKLNLSEEQTGKVEEINMTYFEGLAELKESDLSRLKKYRKFKDIAAKKDKDMKAVLSSEQYEIYKEFQKKMKNDLKAKRKG